MQQGEHSYLPFEGLMKKLEQAGFRLGPDVYIAVRKLLNAALEKEEYLSVADLKYQLGAVVASSRKELRLFYELFDSYVADRLDVAWNLDPQGGNGPADPPLLNKRNWIWYPLSLLPILILAIYFRPLSSPVSDSRLSLGPASGMLLQTIEFKEGRLFEYPEWNIRTTPVPDSVQWWFGDGDSSVVVSIDSPVVHHYQEPGDYEIHERLVFSDVVVSMIDTIRVDPIIRLRADFDYELVDSVYRFTDRSSVYPGEPAFRESDTLTSLTRVWQVGDVRHRSDSIFSIPQKEIDAMGREVTAALYLTVEYNHQTSYREVSRKTVESLPPPDLPSLADQYLNPDISDLLRPQEGDYSLLRFLVALSLAYFIFEAIVAWQRKVTLDNMPSRGPPFRHPLAISPSPLDFFYTKPFHLLVRRLRLRRSGENRLVPAIRESLRQTIRAGGFPTLIWNVRKEPSQYLVLIEQKSSQDHLAQLFAEIAKELASRDISVEVYFFRDDPFICWRKSPNRAIPLNRLQSLYPTYRLLVIGEGEPLLNESGRRLLPECELFKNWRERAWLSTKATEDWGLTEQALTASFVVVPATQEGFEGLVEQWQAEEPRTIKSWKRDSYESAFSGTEWMSEADLLIEIRSYLNWPGMHWLASLAWYPELLWALTLRIGKGIDPLLPPDEKLDLSLDGLIRLFRLPWLRQGKFPREVREALAGTLPSEVTQRARELILELLLEPGNQPPEASYAEADHAIMLALLTYRNSDQQARDKQALKASLETVHPDEIEDHLSVRELQKVKGSPLSLVIPARYFRGNIPFLGIRQKWRALIIGILLVAGTALTWWKGAGGQTADYDPLVSMDAQSLVLDSPADSARWLTHNGYVLLQDSAETASQGLRVALDSFLLPALTMSPGYDMAVMNASMIYLEQYQLAYQAGKYSAVASGLDSVFQSFLMKNDTDRQYRQVQVNLPLAAAIAAMMDEDADAAGRFFDLALCQPIADTLWQATIRDSLAADPLLSRHLSLLVQIDPAPTLLAYLDCLGQEDPRPAVFLHAMLLDAKTRQAVENARVQVPGGPDIISDASGNIFYRYSSVPQNQTPAQVSLQVQAAGYQTASYVFQLHRDSAEVQELRIQPIPEANLQVSVSDTAGCVPLRVQYAFTSDREVASATWLGLEGAALSNNNSSSVSYTFTEAGAYPVALAVTYENGGTDTLTTIPSVQVYEAPVAEILATARAADPLTYDMSAKISQDILQINWTIEDAVYASQNATHTFSAAGTYAIDLAIQGRCGTVTATQEVVVVGKDPKPNFIAPEMVSLPAGTFTMGDVMGDGEFGRELPLHDVTLRSFQMASTELSFAEYDLFCEATNREKPGDENWGRGDRPVINVNWFDAVEYCNWLSEQMDYRLVYTISGQDIAADWTANGFRLPTEAEWEYAARQAGQKVRFGNGRDKADTDEINFDGSADYKKPYSKVGQDREQPLSVRSLRSNSLGLYHMSGNVYEWCWDRYGSYSDAAQRNPYGPQSGVYRVLRGGSWFNGPVVCRTAYRNGYYPDDRGSGIGFRLTRTP